MKKVKIVFFDLSFKMYFYYITDVDEWTDEQQRSMINDNNTEWSIEKILYPDWLYKDITTTSKKHLNTSTFTEFNSSQTSETNGSAMSSASSGRRTISSNSQPSPKQVRFGCHEQIHPHLSTTIRQIKTGITTTMISNNETHHTLI